MRANLAALIVREIEDSIVSKQKLMQNRSLVAQYLSAEFVSRFKLDRVPLASLALVTNTPAISGNDYVYNYFLSELEAVSRLADLLIHITASGNSPNVLKAIEVARRLELRTPCLTGETGGAAKKICECLCVPSRETARIQGVPYPR